MFNRKFLPQPGLGQVEALSVQIDLGLARWGGEQTLSLQLLAAGCS